MLHWLNMGGYWTYVWSSYALTAIAVVLNIALARSDFRAAVRDARRRAEQRRGAA
jgi:heme exporter protein CcmD